MEIRVCPKCNKAFYAQADAEALSCSFCGYVLYDKRNKERTKRQLEFRIRLRGGQLPAKLIDYSDAGARAVYSGQRLSVDTVLEIDIGELDIHTAARTVWTKKVSAAKYASGFKFLN